MNNDELNNIDENTISEDMDVVSPEQPVYNQPAQPVDQTGAQQPNNSKPLNTISNSVNSFKKGYQNSKELAEKVQALKNRKMPIPTNTPKKSENSSEPQSEGKEEKGETKQQSLADKAVNKVASQAISKYTHGVVKAKHIEKILEKSKAVSFAKKQLKIGIAVGVSIGLVFILIVTSLLMNDDDESYTSTRTNNYVMDQSTDQKLLEYMSFIAICPSVDEAKEKAEEHHIELPEGEVTFEVMRALKDFDDIEITPTCLNAMDFYESFKKEYVENKKACYRDRDENKEILPNYWRHDDPEAAFDANPKVQAYFVKGGKARKDEYDCQIVLPTLLIFETMSYDLTDQDLFNKEYLTRPNYVPYFEDLRKLANALSEFMHETCYKWEINYYLRGTHVESCSGPECSAVKTKVPYDGYYFQVSFDKYVCYLKYGDTCTHPNYEEDPKPREKYPDLDYMKHECGGPENDSLSKLGGQKKEEEKIDEIIWLGDSLTAGYISNDNYEPPYKHMGVSTKVSAASEEVGAHAKDILAKLSNPDPNKFYVIWAGNTDYGEAASEGKDQAAVADEVIGLIKNYVESNGLKHYLVLGTQKSDDSRKNYGMINSKLAAAFSGHYKGIQELLVAGDKDKTHFSAESYKAIGESVGKKVKAMESSIK